MTSQHIKNILTNESEIININDQKKNDQILQSDVKENSLEQKTSHTSLTSTSSSSSTTTGAGGLKKNVSFHEIEIKEFPMELGDNPSTCGIPIQLGWTPQETWVLGLDEYEDKKLGMKRSKSEMQIPLIRQLDLVFKSGATMREVSTIKKANEKLQNERDKSIRSMKWDPIHEKIELTQRKLKKVVSWTKSSLTRRRSTGELCDTLPKAKKKSLIPKGFEFDGNTRLRSSWTSNSRSEKDLDCSRSGSINDLDCSRSGSIHDLSSEELCTTEEENKATSAIKRSRLMSETMEIHNMGEESKMNEDDGDDGPICF